MNLLWGIIKYLMWVYSRRRSLFDARCSRVLPSDSNITSSIVFPPCRNSPNGPRPPLYLGFTITLRHTRLGRTPLDEWSARRRDLYPTTHNTHKRQTSMPPVGFEPTISASVRPPTHVLDRAVTGTGNCIAYIRFLFFISNMLFTATIYDTITTSYIF